VYVVLSSQLAERTVMKWCEAGDDDGKAHEGDMSAYVSVRLSVWTAFQIINWRSAVIICSNYTPYSRLNTKSFSQHVTQTWSIEIQGRIRLGGRRWSVLRAKGKSERSLRISLKVLTKASWLSLEASHLARCTEAADILSRREEKDQEGNRKGEWGKETNWGGEVSHSSCLTAVMLKSDAYHCFPL
jgi:hypothetical protein